jgi:hypothetical protein
MITNDGREIISKYLLGQVPAFATHIGIGCGAVPNATGDFSAKKNMDFEMIRVPISSKGFVNELVGPDLVTKMAFTGEMPIVDRLEITEVALWSAASNNNAGSSDSRILFSFGSEENWVVHNDSTGAVTSLSSLYYPSPLDASDGSNDILITDPIFSTTADNSVFLSQVRKGRQEGARYLDNTILIRGDQSTIDGTFDVTASTSHIHLSGKTTNLSTNSLNDEIKVALSLVPQDASNAVIPDITRIVIEFLQSEATYPNTGYARLEAELVPADFAADNRYVVITKKLEDLVYSQGFNWSDTKITRVYVSTYNLSTDVTPSDDYYVALDAIRFDNISTPNPLYVMTGYAVVNTTDGYPIYKIANASNYIEFRMRLGVV